MSEENSSKWTVLGPGSKPRMLLCRCECGTEKEVSFYNIRDNLSRSCGCTRAASIASHGRYGTPEYSAWHHMKQRCLNEKDKRYKDYGGRGITVCERFKSFENFYADLGGKPSPDLTIDRIDNDKGYWCGRKECPECGPANREPNCRWATVTEQNRNSRHVRMITHNGKTQCLKDWAEEAGMSSHTLHARLKAGVPFDRAISEPVREKKKRGAKPET